MKYPALLVVLTLGTTCVRVAHAQSPTPEEIARKLEANRATCIFSGNQTISIGQETTIKNMCRPVLSDYFYASYRLTVAQGQALHISVDGGVDLYDGNRKHVAENSDLAGRYIPAGQYYVVPNIGRYSTSVDHMLTVRPATSTETGALAARKEAERLDKVAVRKCEKDDAASIAVGETVSGELARGSCTNGPGRFYNRYKLNAPSAMRVVVAVTTKKFIPSVEVSNKNDTHISSADHGGLRGRAVAELKRGTNYIEVSSWLEDRGPYTLSVHDARVALEPPPGNCGQEAEIPLSTPIKSSFSNTSCRSEGEFTNYHRLVNSIEQYVTISSSCKSEEAATELTLLDTSGQVLEETVSKRCGGNEIKGKLPAATYIVRVRSVVPGPGKAAIAVAYQIQASCAFGACKGAGLMTTGAGAATPPPVTGAGWQQVHRAEEGTISLHRDIVSSEAAFARVWFLMAADKAQEKSSETTGPFKYLAVLIDMNCVDKTSRAWAVHYLGPTGERVGGDVSLETDEWHPFSDTDNQVMDEAELEKSCAMISAKSAQAPIPAPTSAITSAPTSAPAPAPPPEQTAEPVVRSTATDATGKVLVDYIFDSDRPFEPTEADKCTFSYAGGYAITSKGTNACRRIVDAVPMNGTRIETEIKIALMTEPVAYGIGFGADADAQNFYLFQVNSEGDYAVLKMTPQGDTPARAWDTSPLLKKGEGAVNKLGISIQGNRATLYINGEAAGTVVMTNLPAEGHILLWHNGTGQGTAARIVFTYLKVTNNQ